VRLRDRASLLDILEFIRIITDRMAGMTYEAFLADTEKQDAVTYRVALIGEATTRLSDGFRAAHPEIPWAEIRKMRNFLIHVYDHVDHHEVWDVTQKNLEPLRLAVEAILAAEPEE
jgi:uncharacterized protein with HEPN domain